MAGLSINQVTTYRWTFEEDVAQYSAEGITAIGVWRQKLSDFGEQRGVELLATSGLRVSNLLWAGGFTGSDGRSFQDALADAAEALRLAAELDAPCLVLYTGGRGGHTLNHARRLVREALRKLIPLAEEHDVVLAVEPMHEACAADWTILTGLDDALGLLSEFESDYLRIAFDTYHLGHDERTVSRIAEIVGHVAVVHLGDGHLPPEREQNRCPLGAGSIPLRSIVQRLQQAGYNGDYDVELLGEDVETSEYSELIRHSKRSFAALLEAPL